MLVIDNESVKLSCIESDKIFGHITALTEKSFQNRLDFCRLHTNSGFNCINAMKQVDTVFMCIYRFLCRQIVIARCNGCSTDEHTFKDLSTDIRTEHIACIGKQHLILLFIATKLIFCDKTIVELIQNLTFAKTAKIEVAHLLFKRKGFAFFFQEKAASFIRLVNTCKQTGFILFVKSINVAEIKQIIVIMLCLGHSANTTNRLNFKALAHTFTELDKDFRPGTIPTRADSLLHQKENRSSIVIRKIVGQILFVFAHPLGYHTVVVCITHRLQLFLNSYNGFGLCVRELN